MSADRSFALHDRSGWASWLDEHGYAIIQKVLPPGDVTDSLSDLWALMEALGTVRRSKPATWRASASWPPMLHGGMIQYLGHTPLQWRLRASCSAVFQRYYQIGAEELASSFDGLCMMHGDRAYKAAGNLVSFLHTDQSPMREGEWSIQGLLNLADGGPDDGGLVVVPGSHKEHHAFFESHPARNQKSDWYQLSAAEKARYASRARKVVAEPGDFLLWDSRTFHCNTVPTRKGAVRACVYVCMLPKERIPNYIRVKRETAWQQRRVSCHHPGDGFRLFPPLPSFVVDRDNFYRKVLALQQGFELTLLQRSLVCGQPTEAHPQ